MWKAVLILFLAPLTSPEKPEKKMVGVFPKTFFEKSACKDFIIEKNNEIDTTVAVFTKHSKLNFKVTSYDLKCIEDTDGNPA